MDISVCQTYLCSAALENTFDVLRCSLVYREVYYTLMRTGCLVTAFDQLIFNLKLLFDPSPMNLGANQRKLKQFGAPDILGALLYHDAFSITRLTSWFIFLRVLFC